MKATKNTPGEIIRKQLKEDLIGKDAFRGVTISYTWLANQFGHIGLGFIPAAMLYVWIYHGKRVASGMWGPAAAILFIWIIIELKNYGISILPRKKDSFTKRKARARFYNPRKWHFINDLFTDLLFFGFGAFLAGLLFDVNIVTVAGFIFFSTAIAYHFKYWYLSKIYLQRALYPFQYRLSQWDRHISQANTDAVNKFMEASYPGTHLLVLGEDDDEKIHLCVGIGSEVSYQLKKCRYLTAMKAFECFYRYEAEDSPDAHQKCWNWEESELVIIDDINPSHAHIKEVIAPDEFYEKITANYAEENKKLLREKKVIWMLGNEEPDGHIQRTWKYMLVKTGVDPDNIITIDLTGSKQLLG
jgi:hypothetical protein